MTTRHETLKQIKINIKLTNNFIERFGHKKPVRTRCGGRICGTVFHETPTDQRMCHFGSSKQGSKVYMV